MSSRQKRRIALRPLAYACKATDELDACKSIEEVEALARKYARYAKAAPWHPGYSCALGAAQGRLLRLGVREWWVGGDTPHDRV